MFEGTEEPARPETNERTRQPEPGHPAAGENQGDPEGGAGRRKAEATPEIGAEGNVGETQRPAAEDDVGVPENPGDQKDEE